MVCYKPTPTPPLSLLKRTLLKDLFLKSNIFSLMEYGTLCGGTELDFHEHPMRLRTDGNPIAFMDSQWQC